MLWHQKEVDELELVFFCKEQITMLYIVFCMILEL